MARGAYDERVRPMPVAGDTDVLRYLMEERGLTQNDLPEIGAQSVVSSILYGKRHLNGRQICGLSDRFGIPADVCKQRKILRDIS